MGWVSDDLDEIDGEREEMGVGEERNMKRWARVGAR